VTAAREPAHPVVPLFTIPEQQCPRCGVRAVDYAQVGQVFWALCATDAVRWLIRPSARRIWQVAADKPPVELAGYEAIPATRYRPN
jgi:hypothetical protein